MAVRRHQTQPVNAEADAARRFRAMGRFLMAAEPGSPAAVLSSRIRTEVEALERLPLSHSERLQRLSDFLDHLEPLATGSTLTGRTLRENAERAARSAGS